MKYFSFASFLLPLSLLSLSCQNKENTVVDTMGEMPIGANAVVSIDMTKPVFDIVQRAWTQTELAENLIGEHGSSPFQSGDYTQLGFDTSE